MDTIIIILLSIALACCVLLNIILNLLEKIIIDNKKTIKNLESKIEIFNDNLENKIVSFKDELEIKIVSLKNELENNSLKLNELEERLNKKEESIEDTNIHKRLDGLYKKIETVKNECQKDYEGISQQFNEYKSSKEEVNTNFHTKFHTVFEKVDELISDINNNYKSLIFETKDSIEKKILDFGKDFVKEEDIRTIRAKIHKLEQNDELEKNDDMKKLLLDKTSELNKKIMRQRSEFENMITKYREEADKIEQFRVNKIASFEAHITREMEDIQEHSRYLTSEVMKLLSKVFGRK